MEYLNMQRKIFATIVMCLTLLILSSFSYAETVEVKGVVFEDANHDKVFDASESPLPGVAVSDGKTVTSTNKQGRYQLQTEARRIVFVSVPATYHAAENEFYVNVGDPQAGAREINFPLVVNEDATLDGKFTFVFLSDTHMGFEDISKDGVAKAYLSVAKLHPALVIHGGDIVSDALRTSDERLAEQDFKLYKSELAPIIKSPFYHGIGNHDVFGWVTLPDPKPVPRLYGKKMFEKYFGPTYYSFNYKQCHFVILDSISRTKTDAGETTYYGSIGPTELEWLQKDLTEIDRSHPVIMVSHIPTINALGSCFGVNNEVVSTPFAEKTLKHQIANLQQLFADVLGEYNFKLALAGHYHTFEEVHWKDNMHDAKFVVGGSICGDWWKGDRTIGRISWPRGYTVVKVDGENFEVSYVPLGQLDIAK